MQLTADQALRKELLLAALAKQPDLEAALAMAAEMERYILGGGEMPGGPAAQAGAESGRAASERAAPAQTAGPAVCAAREAGPYGSGGTKRRWTDGDDETLKELWHSSATLEEIADTLNRTTPSLYCRARALGLAKRAQPPKPAAPPQAADKPVPMEATSETQPAAAADGGQARDVSGPERPAPARNEKNSVDMKLERYSTAAARVRDRRRPAPARVRKEGNGFHARAGLSASMAKASCEDMSVDSIVQFLRSRDYSVVRVSDGKFRLDGRQELSVDELRNKANQLRETLGQPPFATRRGEAVN